MDNWANVLFSDESRFGILPDSKRLRVWREPGNINRLTYAQEVHSYQDGTIMVWGGISVHGRTDLVLLAGFMTGMLYRNTILLPIVIPYAAAVGPRFIFMHDNARLHTSRVATDEHNIDVLSWPAQSPDINTIEHLWDILQLRVFHMGRLRDNPQNLFLSLTEAWNGIPQEGRASLIFGMLRRFRAVLTARGGQKYQFVARIQF